MRNRRILNNTFYIRIWWEFFDISRGKDTPGGDETVGAKYCTEQLTDPRKQGWNQEHRRVACLGELLMEELVE